MIEKEFKLGTIIAERELFFHSKRKKQKIIVKMGKPKYLQKSDSWYCPIQITGIGFKKICAAYGEDSMQSLQLAIKLIIINLSHFQKTQSGKLIWLGQEQKVISKIFLASNTTL
ncbi:DUF6968 family protein [Leptospira noguchii]|uniref:DUF6968 domain-containing protein n=3 Tax=Leptospira noguchii TaxID=28182 RepID=T0FIT7_9LEPT|nr:hypothetical protein [Leptospira noguchii]EQA69984.1 hypothetical protein LEP1GSC059_2001 [Leptospira noguchii serovar Panama str. CZ214]UOG40256.1 hypothetical protein MAL05_10025 [Leptospira noguchii]